MRAHTVFAVVVLSWTALGCAPATVTELEGDEAGECDDADPAVLPQAGDVYADGVDSDCDGLDCKATMDGAVYFALCSPGLWADAAAVCSAGGHDFGSVQSDAENALLEDLCAYLDIDGSGGCWPLGSWDDTTCATGGTRALLCTDR